MKLKTRRRKYLREATVILATARLAVRWLPAARVLAWAGRAPRRINRFSQDEVGWVAWSVETIGDKQWMKALCLPRALAAQAMLRRRGIASRLCLGVARDGEALAAHAWLELGREIVVGGAETPRFQRLVEFGGKPA
jgi:hypothetical protein